MQIQDIQPAGSHSSEPSIRQDDFENVMEQVESPMNITVLCQDDSINMLKDQPDYIPQTQDIHPEGRGGSEPSIHQEHLEVTEMVPNILLRKPASLP